MRKAGLPTAADSFLRSRVFGRGCRRAGEPAGLAAASFRTLTGNPPPAGPNRARISDNLFVPGNVARNVPDHVMAALFNALAGAGR